MVGYIEKSVGGDFKPTPEGQHTMICCRVIDLGTQKTEYQGQIKHQRKILITWELPEQRTQIDGRDAPMLHSERYTWSFHEKASLRKLLESWRGVRFRDEDFNGENGGFHISKLLGVPCLGQVLHEEGNGKTYANLNSIMKYPGPPSNWPKPETAPLFFDLDNVDRSIFDGLPAYWKGVIAGSPEGRDAGLTAPDQSGSHGQSNDPGPQPDNSRPTFDDEVPF